jgi:hypothetical protein
MHVQGQLCLLFDVVDVECYAVCWHACRSPVVLFYNINVMRAMLSMHSCMDNTQIFFCVDVLRIILFSFYRLSVILHVIVACLMLS